MSDTEEKTNLNENENLNENKVVEDTNKPPKDSEENDLTTKLQNAYEKNESIQNKYLRALADIENIRKRSSREREESVTRTRVQLFSDLLPILDAFNLGLKEAEKTDNGKEVVQGFVMAMNQFEGAMKEYGLNIIEPSGESFDPSLHEAIGYEESKGDEDGIVLKTIRTGYKLKNNLLRPASVILVKNGVSE
jgi:molecular chaperone GrpE